MWGMLKCWAGVAVLPLLVAAVAEEPQQADWQAYIPQEAVSCFADAPRHTLAQGEKAILKAQGIDFGEARAPFGRLSTEVEKELLDTVLPLLD